MQQELDSIRHNLMEATFGRDEALRALEQKVMIC